MMDYLNYSCNFANDVGYRPEPNKLCWHNRYMMALSMGHNSINLDLATNCYLCECLTTFDSSQHCIELLSHAVLSKLNTTQKSSCPTIAKFKTV